MADTGGPAARPAAADDLHTLPHKALRVAMAEALVGLGAADPACAGDLPPRLRQVGETLALLRAHLRHENDVLHTALEARQPGASRRSAAQHAERADTLALLEAELQALQQRLQRDDAGTPRALARLERHLAEGFAAQLRHMAHEEAVDAPALAAWYPGEQGRVLLLRLLERMRRDDLVAMLAWMRAALAPQELQRAAHALEQALGAPVTAQLWQQVQQRPAGADGAAAHRPAPH